MRWFAQPWMKKQALGRVAYVLGLILGAVIDGLANLSPYAASRIWGFWVGGFEEVSFTFRRPAAPPAVP